MEDLTAEPVSHYFLKDDYPEKLEQELDQHLQDKLDERFRRRFSWWERSDIIGNRNYNQDNIEEIADTRGDFSDTVIKSGAERLLDAYNGKADGLLRETIEEEDFVWMELGWIADELLETAERRNRSVDLGEGTRIGYQEGRYAAFSGQPVDISEMDELASVIDDEIKFEHFKVGNGAASAYHHTSPEDYEEFVKFDHELPYGRLRSFRNGSRLRATEFDEQIPVLANIIKQ